MIHAEPLGLKGRLTVRYSFFTKLVDYFHTHRTILAVGPRGIASMDYLIQNDAGIVTRSLAEIKTALRRLTEDSKMLEEYAVKAWACGRRNHQITEIQTMVYNDLKFLIKE